MLRAAIGQVATLGILFLGGLWWFSRVPNREAPPPTPAPRAADIKKVALPPDPPGWKDITLCTPFTSSDGTAELAFKSDQTVKRGRDEGRWTYDAARQRYVISVGVETQSYTLFDHSGVELCILVPGGTQSADLDKSWFSNYRQNEADEEIERPEPDPREGR
jgi:hypothetical protein